MCLKASIASDFYKLSVCVSPTITNRIDMQNIVCDNMSFWLRSDIYSEYRNATIVNSESNK